MIVSKGFYSESFWNGSVFLFSVFLHYVFLQTGNAFPRRFSVFQETLHGRSTQTFFPHVARKALISLGKTHAYRLGHCFEFHSKII